MEKYKVEMTKDECLRYYANKIVEDGIRDCSEFNTSCYLTDYMNMIDLTKYKKEILELIHKDERIADVMIDDNLRIDMVFWTSYCPYFYDEVENIDQKEEYKILEDFYYYSMSQMLDEMGAFYLPVRVLINNYVDVKYIKDDEKKENIYNILKKSIANLGFLEKYIEDNNETYLTDKNKSEFKELLEKYIDDLKLEQESEEEF